MSHKKDPVLRVEFTKPAVESSADLDAALEIVAKKAEFASASDCLSVTRFKMKKSGATQHAHGFAEIVVCKGCPQKFLTLFRISPLFLGAQLI